MTSPTSRYIPIDTAITQEQWDALNDIIEAKRVELRKVPFNDPESSLWVMEQLEYFREMKRYHAHRYNDKATEGNKNERIVTENKT